MVFKDPESGGQDSRQSRRHGHRLAPLVIALAAFRQRLSLGKP